MALETLNFQAICDVEYPNENGYEMSTIEKGRVVVIEKATMSMIIIKYLGSFDEIPIGPAIFNACFREINRK